MLTQKLHDKFPIPCRPWPFQHLRRGTVSNKLRFTTIPYPADTNAADYPLPHPLLHPLWRTANHFSGKLCGQCVGIISPFPYQKFSKRRAILRRRFNQFLSRLVDTGIEFPIQLRQNPGSVSILRLNSFASLVFIRNRCVFFPVSMHGI